MNALTHSIVHLASLVEVSRRIFDEDDTPTASELALLCIVMAITLQFTPRDGDAWQLLSDVVPDALTRQRQLYSLALSLLKSVGEEDESAASLEQIQTRILVHYHGQGTETGRQSSLVSARRLLHLVEGQVQADPLRKEMWIRCWWYLHCRTWFSALNASTLPSATKSPQALPPSQLPRECMDRDCNGDPIVDSQLWTPVRYSLSVIGLCRITREVLEDKVKDTDAIFNSYIASLPSLLRLDSPFSRDFYPADTLLWAYHGRCDVEKWLLHHQIFFAYLKCQQHSARGAMQQPAGYGSVGLARHILEIHLKIRARCPIVDSMRWVVPTTT